MVTTGCLIKLKVTYVSTNLVPWLFQETQRKVWKMGGGRTLHIIIAESSVTRWKRHMQKHSCFSTWYSQLSTMIQNVTTCGDAYCAVSISNKSISEWKYTCVPDTVYTSSPLLPYILFWFFKSLVWDYVRGKKGGGKSFIQRGHNIASLRFILLSDGCIIVYFFPSGLVNYFFLIS